MPVKAYVLQDFGKSEQETLDLVLDRTVSSIETIIKEVLILDVTLQRERVVILEIVKG